MVTFDLLFLRCLMSRKVCILFLTRLIASIKRVNTPPTLKALVDEQTAKTSGHVLDG